jgi:hypothetical protein
MVDRNGEISTLGPEWTVVRSAILVSFYYLKTFLLDKRRYVYRNWALDSGAFSAHQSKVSINLDEYIRMAKGLQDSDPTLTEIFGLDVIGEWKPSLANTEKMWAAGVPAIPTYHPGEPEDYLKGIARDYPKIAIGGVAMLKGPRKIEFAQQVFARVWPKKIHGFGFGGAQFLQQLPFHSVDATNWETNPGKFGRWESVGRDKLTRLSIRGSVQDLRGEVAAYLRRERIARDRWRVEMVSLGDPVNVSPTIRLAIVGTAREEGAGLKLPVGMTA